MRKTKDALKREMRNQYECACNRYLAELLRMWELDSYYGYWIGEQVGGVYDYDGGFTISMEDIIYCVEEDVTRKQYTEWQDYVCDAIEFGMATPNLRSWMMGCPRTNAETFERLRRLKAELQKAVEDEKGRAKNGRPGRTGF